MERKMHSEVFVDDGERTVYRCPISDAQVELPMDGFRRFVESDRGRTYMGLLSGSMHSRKSDGGEYVRISHIERQEGSDGDILVSKRPSIDDEDFVKFAEKIRSGYIGIVEASDRRSFGFNWIDLLYASHLSRAIGSKIVYMDVNATKPFSDFDLSRHVTAYLVSARHEFTDESSVFDVEYRKSGHVKTALDIERFHKVVFSGT